MQGAALDTALPLVTGNMGSNFRIIGEPDDHQHNYNGGVTAVSGGYERLMGTPVIRGRMVSEDDAANTPLSSPSTKCWQENSLPQKILLDSKN